MHAVKWICAVGTVLFTSPAQAAPQQEIGSLSLVQAQCDRFTIQIHIGPDWKASPNPNNDTYKVYRMAGPTSLPLMASSDNSTIEITGLQAFMSYKIFANARSRRAGGGGIPLYRKVGELTVVTPNCSTPSEFAPQPGDVRLRHEASGKCIFGNPVDGGPAKNWTCWNDPQMAVSLEPLGGANVRIRMRAKGKCLFGSPVNGGEVKNWVCWNDPNMVFVRESLGGNRVRLRHEATGKCMYGNSTNGEAVKNWTCWDDPNMVWVIDPF
ncbi:MAG TPA: hypothetical protein VGB04_02370 [Allosphingosinicella sp.]|jgi:hypothetical protein